MPTLKKLTPEVNNALGNKFDFQTRYEGLIQKSNEGQLKGNEDAIRYIDDVVRRYNMIKGTSPSSSDLQAKKEAYLPLLRAHAAEVGIHTFSKPGDLASRLKELDFEPSKIEEITKGLEQAGDDDFLAILLSSLIVTSATCEEGHHHHHHHSQTTITVPTPGYGNHHYH